jgi:hypothetical protein
MIQELRPYLSRRRERVKPKLAAFLGWLDRQRIHAGPGLLVQQTENGTVISATPPPGFVGAFRVDYSGQFAKVGVGFVNGVVPTIEKKKLTDSPAPRLPVRRKEKFWIFVEVTVDVKTERINPEDPEAVVIVENDKKTSSDKLKGRHPIALVQGQRVYQLAYFSLNHAYVNGRHFFVPA